MALYAAKIKVRGKVQDVSFRSFAKRSADMLGLKGYVNNMPNGGVEVVVEGNKDHIETLIETSRAIVRPALDRLHKDQVFNLRSGREPFLRFEIPKILLYELPRCCFFRHSFKNYNISLVLCKRFLEILWVRKFS